MYEIYVNDNPLLLMNQEEYQQMEPASEAVIAAHYRGKKKELLPYIDLLEKSERHAGVWLRADDENALFEDFKSLFKIVEAAGGLVFDQTGKALIIFRLEHWDLPKGKIDPGETPEIAALREVGEETGLKAAQLVGPLPTTYHTYRNRKGKRVLKPTYWYRMSTVDTTLKLQVEEGIKEGEWHVLEEVLQENRKFYQSIKKLLEKAIRQN